MQESLRQQEISTAEIGPACFVVTAGGALQGESALELEAQLLPLVGVPGTRVLVDLASAHSVDMTTVGVLSAAAHVSYTGGGELVLITSDPWLDRLFEETGLSALARVERTLREGVARAAGGSSA
jgi:anti-anti-sigma factor